MHRVSLAHPADFNGWRAYVRQCIAQDIAPDEVEWAIEPPADLFASQAKRALPSAAIDLRIPRWLASLIAAALQSDAPDRFTALHRVVADLHVGTNGLDDGSDTQLPYLRALSHQAHVATQDLRNQFLHAITFRTLDAGPVITADSSNVLAGQRHILTQLAAEPWRIRTPGLSIDWDGRRCRIGNGAGEPCHAGPENEYWNGIPAIMLPTDDESIAHTASLDELRTKAADCRRCPLWEPATRTVFGEGSRSARLMFVGEQPGDQEDLAGHPFVGPAGRLFDEILARAGIPRDACYITNAVKHFKFTPRGSRRIHQKPDADEMRACLPWLAAERRLVKPQVLVMLGVTAATSVLGRSVTISRERSRAIPLDDGCTGIVTVHPSFLLRVPDADTKARETQRFEEDLRMAWRLLD